MLATILGWLGVNPIKTIADALTKAHADYLAATTAEQQAVLKGSIEQLHATLAALQAQADVNKAAMAHRMFWVAWSIAAIPAAFWFGWGMLDSAIANGTVLPDVAALPPQLKAYFDVVWQNIFYSGGIVASAGLGVKGVTAIADAIRGRKP